MLAEAVFLGNPVTVKDRAAKSSTPFADSDDVGEETLYDALATNPEVGLPTFRFVTAPQRRLSPFVESDIDAHQVFGQSANPSVSDDAGHDISSEASVGSIRHFLDAYIKFEALASELSQPRGDESQEAFFFGSVKKFVTDYGLLGMSMLDDLITTRSLPVTARYYYPYLLGHMIDRTTYAPRVSYLRKYVRSTDDALRLGAAEAFEHLSSF